jgi:hypothetical protein
MSRPFDEKSSFRAGWGNAEHWRCVPEESTNPENLSTAQMSDDGSEIMLHACRKFDGIGNFG